MQDIYVGPGLQGIPRGTIKKLRVIAMKYRAAGIGEQTERLLLLTRMTLDAVAVEYRLDLLIEAEASRRAVERFECLRSQFLRQCGSLDRRRFILVLVAADT